MYIWKFGKKWAEIGRKLKTRNENDVKNRYLSLEKLYLNDQMKCQMEDQKSTITIILKKFLSNNQNLKSWLDSNMNENICSDTFINNLMIESCEEENFVLNSEELNQEIKRENSLRFFNSEEKYII